MAKRNEKDACESKNAKEKATGHSHGFRDYFHVLFGVTLSLNRNNLTAVRCINIKRTAIHNKKTLLVINSKESN